MSSGTMSSWVRAPALRVIVPCLVALFLALATPLLHATPVESDPHAEAFDERFDLKIPLTDDEKAYLASLPTLRLGIAPDWQPFAFVDADGHPSGISGDYLRYITTSLGLKVERVPSATWPETLKLANQGRVDLLASVTQNTALGSGFLLSRQYNEYPSVIVTRQEAPYVDGIGNLTGSRVAVIEGSDVGFEPETQNVQFITATSAEDGLARVAHGSVYAYIGNLGVVETLIRRNYPGVLRVAAPTGYSESLHFAVSSQYADLLPLIDRVLQAVSQDDHERIQNTWLSTRVQYKLPARTLWHVIVPVAIVTLAFIAVLGVIIFFLRREVRQRRWTERELRYQWQFQQMLMNTVPIPIFVKDLDNRYVAINPAYEETVGVRAVDLLGKTSLQASHVAKEGADRFNQLSEQVIATGEPAHGSLQYVSSRGETRDAMYWLRLCYADDKTPRAVLGASIDLTELRNIERREMELKLQLEELTKMLPAVTFQLRFTPHWGFTPIFVSEHARALVGLSPEQLVEEPRLFLERVPPADWRRVERALLEAVRGQSMRELEFPLRRADGDEAWVRLEAVSRPDTGSAHILSGYLIDVTYAKRQAESLAAAKHAAEEASRVKDTFLATMSHEIRTPMSGMIGVLDLMNRSALSADQQHLLDMARGSAGTLMRILNDILDFSKNQRGDLALEAIPFAMRELVDEVSGLFAPEMHRKGLRFDVEVRSEVAMRHVGDQHRVSQVLLNLVSNALKFTESGGVSIAVEGDETKGGSQRLRLKVRDTGIGIAQEDQDHLFVPFSQADASTSRRFGGTGLGLAICRQLAEAMDGTVTLHSRPGEGTEVVVEIALPVIRDTTRSKRAREAWLSIGDQAAQRALAEYLKALNVRIVTSADLVKASEEPLLVFRETRLALPLIERPLVVFEVSRDVEAPMLGMQGGDHRLSINPLRWAEIVAALRVADAEDSDGPALDSLSSDVNDGAKGMAFPGRVLVVEDQPINQELLLRQLAALHVTDCELAGNGQEALKALDKGHFPLVITDCAMPVMDGVELIRRIRAREAGGAPRAYLVALTANATDTQKTECMEAGVDEVLIKPVELEQLSSLLKRAVGPGSDKAQSTPSTTDAPPVHIPPGIPAEQMPALLARLREGFVDDMRKLRETYAHDNLTDAAAAAHRILGAARWFKLESIIDAAEGFEDAASEERGHEEALAELEAAVNAFLKG
ncbi:transporter substrate-binding domain-containing protein [Luteibacter jiangsuensis]|uniref:histidine kinase n=1 Tax=Luteibacter jiangsuensis TaxID=637577 RepID=A0ABX0Q4J0_9GAMM|nr:ATP-binding protein [Luteibacter jiangsuensis]NID04701.1 transporter substrate-binding domain-containing protein [Luteibacter jiangsuensis]